MKLFNRTDKQIEDLVVPVEAPVVLSTSEIIGESIKRIQVPVNNVHLAKLATVIHIDYNQMNMPFLTGSLIRSFIEDGFVWMVDESFVKKFKYVAGVGNDMVPVVHAGNNTIRRNATEHVRYIGDIPDFALDRIHQIKPHNTSLTIHSNQPLPIQI